MQNELRKKMDANPIPAKKKSREERARQTRESLVKSGFKVVSRQGYAKASVARITEASGVAAGTFYSYFDSHQQFLDQLLPTEGVHLLDILGQSAHQSADYFDHEKRTFLAFFAYLKRKPYFLRVLTEAEIAAPQSFAHHMRNIEDRYLRALHRAQEKGQIRPQGDRSFRVIAEVLSGARGHIAIGFCNRSSAHAFRLGHVPEWAANAYVKFIRHGLGRQDLIKTMGLPGGKPPRRVRPQDTRSILLDSAARVVHRSGYAGASVQAITELAGVAVGTFYAHFSSRRELFDELLNHIRSDMVAEVKEAVRGSQSFAELECYGFYGFFDYLVRNPWYVRVETEAAVWAPMAYLRHFFDLSNRYLKALRRSWAQGELQAYKEHELPVLAYIFMAARHYLATRYILATSTPKRLPSWLSTTYVELVCRGLEAPSQNS